MAPHKGPTPGSGSSGPSSGAIEGPFEHYAADVASVESAGGKAITQQESFHTLESNITDRENAAVNQVSDSLVDKVREAPKTPKSDSSKLGKATLLVGGATRLFAQAIRTYNGHIDELNAEYTVAASNDFGTPLPNGGTQPPPYGPARAAALLQARLEKKRQRYERNLDDAADTAARMLNQGPTTQNLVALCLAGCIPVERTSRATTVPIDRLKNMRDAVANLKDVVGVRGNAQALSKYLMKLKPGQLKEYPSQVRAQAKALIGMTPTEQAEAMRYLASLKRPTTVATTSRLFRGWGVFKAGAARTAAGKALAVLGIAFGGWGIYTTIRDWEYLTPEQRTLGLLGNGLGVAAGALAIAAAAASSPVLAAIAVGASVVGLGVTVYQNWDKIVNSVGNLVDDIGAEPGDGTPSPSPGPSPTPAPTGP